MILTFCDVDKRLSSIIKKIFCIFSNFIPPPPPPPTKITFVFYINTYVVRHCALQRNVGKSCLLTAVVWGNAGDPDVIIMAPAVSSFFAPKRTMCQASRIMWAIDAVKPYDAFSAA